MEAERRVFSKQIVIRLLRRSFALHTFVLFFLYMNIFLRFACMLLFKHDVIIPVLNVCLPVWLFGEIRFRFFPSGVSDRMKCLLKFAGISLVTFQL